MHKIILLLNGISDEPLKDLDYRTPLQVANTNAMDKLASSSFYSVDTGSCGGVESAMFSMLGGVMVSNPIAQAPLKACALGYRLTKNQLAFSLRFISVAEGVVVNVDNDIINQEEGRALCRSLSKHFSRRGYHFIYLQNSEAVLVAEKAIIADSMIVHEGNPIAFLNREWLSQVDTPMGNFLSELNDYLNQHEINGLRYDLEEDSVNGVLLSQGGILPKVFHDDRDGLEDIILYSDSMSSIGVAKVLGVEAVSLELNNYEEKIPEFIGAIEEMGRGKGILIWENNLIWESTYHGNLLEKIKRIEYLDKVLVAPIYEYARQRGIDLMVLPLKNSSIHNGSWMAGSVPMAKVGDKNSIGSRKYCEEGAELEQNVSLDNMLF